MGTIKDITGAEKLLNGCLGCEIARGNLVPCGGLLYKDEYFVINQDYELPIDGFIIISSVKHIEKFTDLMDEARVDLVNLINKTLTILRQNQIAEEYNIILEEKKNYHFHIWLMPRHKWMIEKFGKILKNIKPIQEYALENLRTSENIEKIAKTCKILKSELNK